jgi:hypothetical protein
MRLNPPKNEFSHKIVKGAEPAEQGLFQPVLWGFFLKFWLRFLSSFFYHGTIYESCISGIFGVIYFGPMHYVLSLTLTCCSSEVHLFS